MAPLGHQLRFYNLTSGQADMAWLTLKSPALGPLVYSFLIYWNILKIEDLVYFMDYEDWNYTLPTYCFYWNIYKIGKMVHSLFLQDIGIWKIVINQLIIDNINSHEDDGQPLGYLILGELRSNEPS